MFIAFVAREERFPHGFIAFSLFIFPKVPKCVLRSIFEVFGRPSGSLSTSLCMAQRGKSRVAMRVQ